jgi:hypothetical protein
MPFENGVADVTGCNQVGVVPFSDCDLLLGQIGYSVPCIIHHRVRKTS